MNYLMEYRNELKYLKQYKAKSCTIRDCYLDYYDNAYHNGFQLIDFKTFKSIIQDYFKYIESEIIDNGREYTLPYQLGKLYVVKSKTKKVFFDFSKMGELGRPIKTLNEHSDGWRYRFKWQKKDILNSNCKKYRLMMVRSVKRKLASIINNKLMDYIED